MVYRIRVSKVLQADRVKQLDEVTGNRTHKVCKKVGCIQGKKEGVRRRHEERNHFVAMVVKESFHQN